MSARSRWRRGLGLLALALACGGLAASEVSERVRAAEQEHGPPVAVVVAARDLEAGAEIAADDLRVSEVPARYAPPDSPAAVAQTVGLRVAGPVAAGSPITAGVVGAGAGERPGALRRGERAIEIAVAGGAALAEGAAPGSLVDVVVSTGASDGPGKSFLALERVELLGLRGGEGGGLAEGGAAAPAAAGSVLATLRVSPRQAVYLTAAQAFAAEVRLLVRPRGDRRRVGRAAVGAEDL